MHQHPTTTSILSIIHHPSSIINKTNQHLSSTSILSIIRHLSSKTSTSMININPSHHPTSSSLLSSISITQYPSTTPISSNIIFFLINYQNQLPSTSIIHRQHHHPTSSSLSSITRIIFHQHRLLLHLLMSSKGKNKKQQARNPPCPGVEKPEWPSALQPTTEIHQHPLPTFMYIYNSVLVPLHLTVILHSVGQSRFRTICPAVPLSVYLSPPPPRPYNLKSWNVCVIISQVSLLTQK